MKAKGKIKITDELELNNPNLEIESVRYDWIKQTVSIDINFTEGDGVFKHNRTFVYSNEGGKELGSEDILNFIKNDETLKIFK